MPLENPTVERFLFDLDIPENPGSNQAFIDDIRRLIQALPEVDTSLQIIERENNGIPLWTPDEQAEQAISVIADVLPEHNLAPKVLAPIANQAVSFYTVQDIKNAFPNEDLVTELHGFSLRREHAFDIDIRSLHGREEWERFHNIFIQYYSACEQLSAELRARIKDIEYQFFIDHAGVTSTKTTSTIVMEFDMNDDGSINFDSNVDEIDMGTTITSAIKMHHPDLSLRTRSPINFALSEYRIRMHEICHLFQQS